MPATAALSLVDRYTAAFAGSKTRFAAAKQLFPCGVTHDARMMEPFPVYITHAKGAYKWDVDGHKLVDYFVGHGSHILGHCPDDVVKAVQDQMAKGTHYGACHDLEIEWGELVRKLVPSAERVRFTGSGTEATMMALRLSRLFTGRPKFLRFQGHFHGWHDYVTVSSDPPYDATTVPGVPDAVASQCVAIPPNDLNKVEEAFKTDASLGAVILEPTGGHWGGVPIRGAFLKGLRELCTKYDRLLIFDEVITGFRVAPGGAGLLRREADLTTLAKILAGGLPGGCVAGRADILAYIEPRPGKPKMKHPAPTTRTRVGVRGRRDTQAHRHGRTVRQGERRGAAVAERTERAVRVAELAVGRLRRLLDGPRGAELSRRAPQDRRGRQRLPRALRRRRQRIRWPEEHEARVRAASGDAAERHRLVGSGGHDDERTQQRRDHRHREGVRDRGRNRDRRRIGVVTSPARAARRSVGPAAAGW